MSTRDTMPGERSLRWNLLLALSAAALAAIWFIDQNVLHFKNYDLATYTDYYWQRRQGLIPHILGGSVAILSGLVQLWLGLTGRIGALHRALGKVYVSAIVVASCGAIYLAVTIPSTNFAYGAGLFFLAMAWIITTGMAVISIRNRALEQHREWMIRSYIVTFAFVTFRLVEKYLLKMHLAPDAEIDSLMAFASWAVPLLLAEPFIQWRRLARG
jgi:uncharacterized membrane protein